MNNQVNVVVPRCSETTTYPALQFTTLLHFVGPEPIGLPLSTTVELVLPYTLAAHLTIVTLH